jgi:uracil-DNA glycosylase
MAEIPLPWRTMLRGEIEQPYFGALQHFVAEERRRGPVYPEDTEVYSALELTSPAAVKVVLLGQDPSPGVGQAHGLSFSVRPGVALPASLRNIFAELQSDIGCTPPPHGCLRAWAERGVLLLNSILTVRGGEIGSHAGHGWENLTDAMVRQLSAQARPLVFVLWGKPAQRKQVLIDSQRHTVVCCAHPSPLSARNGFLGSRPFSRINQALIVSGQAPIDWQL